LYEHYFVMPFGGAKMAHFTFLLNRRM